MAQFESTRKSVTKQKVVIVAAILGPTRFSIVVVYFRCYFRSIFVRIVALLSLSLVVLFFVNFPLREYQPHVYKFARTMYAVFIVLSSSHLIRISGVSRKRITTV